MKKRVTRAGILDSIPSLISGVQNYTETNLENLLRVFTQSPGVACRVVDGVATGTNLLASGYTDNKVWVFPGYAITPDYQYIRKSTGSELTGVTDGYYIVAKYAETNADYASDINGFVYPSGLTAFKTINATHEISAVAPGSYDSDTELLLGVFDADADTVTDLRISGVLQLRDSVISELYPTIDKTDIFFSGLIGASGLYIGDNVKIVSDGTEPTYTITASGFYEVMLAGSGIADAGTYDRGDDEGTRTLVDEEHMLTAHSNGMSGPDELEALFRYGVINYDDTIGNREITATPIPVNPNMPSGLEASIYSKEADAEFKSELDSAGIAFNVTQSEKSKILLGRNRVTDLQTKIVNRLIESPSETVSGCYVSYRDGTNYPASASGVWASVTGIVTGGYSYGSTYTTVDAESIGWTNPGNANGINLVDTINDTSSYVGLLLSNDSDSIKAAVDAKQLEIETAAASLLDQHNKSRIFPDKAQRSFWCRMAWDAPALVNSQKIKNYELKVMQVSSSVVQYKLMNELHASENIPYVKGEYKYFLSPESRSTDLNKQTHVDYGAGANPKIRVSASDFANKQVYISGVDSTEVSIGDRVIVGSEYSRIRDFSLAGGAEASGLIYLYIAASGADDADVQILSKVADYDLHGIYSTTYSFDIVPDHRYMVYARTISEYGYASAWTSGVYVDVRAETPVGEDYTVQSLINAETKRLADAEVIKTKAISLDTEKQLVSLEQAIAAAPNMTSFANLVTAVNNIANSGVTGFVSY